MILSRWITMEIFLRRHLVQVHRLNKFKPLFISVAESMVIFAPIDQFGCCKASFLVIPCSSVRVLPKNGPPEQVRMRRRTSPVPAALKGLKERGVL